MTLTKLLDGAVVTMTPGEEAQTTAAWAAADAARAAYVPPEVPALQLRRAARALGQYAAIVSYITTNNGDVLDWWQSKSTIRRDDPTLATIAAALGVSSNALNTLFRNAAALPPQ